MTKTTESTELGIFVSDMAKKIESKPYAQDYPAESVALLRSLIAKGLNYSEAKSMACDFYNYDDHMRDPNQHGKQRKRPRDIFRRHYTHAMGQNRAEVTMLSAPRGEIMEPSDACQWAGKIITRNEGLAILSDIARGKSRVAQLPSMDLEVPIVPTPRDQARAIQLIFAAMGWDAPKKVDVSMTMIDQLGAAGIIVDKDGISEAEVVDDPL